MGKAEYYEGIVHYACSNYVAISYDNRQVIADREQLLGLRLQKGQPVMFAMRDGRITNIDLDGSRIPTERQVGRVSALNLNRDIGFLVGDDGMEIFFRGTEVNGSFPQRGSRVSYKVVRSAKCIKAVNVTLSNTASTG